MIIAAEYSLNNGKDYITKNFPDQLAEVYNVINYVDASKCFDKVSKEKTMKGKLLYSPASLNDKFKNGFFKKGWVSHREKCDYPTNYYTNEYSPKPLNSGAFRDMDFVKNKLGVEIQFGKYAFMVYNVCAKMTIFSNLGVISAGIEVVPVKGMADNMSSGVSYFEQFVWDLEKRGTSNIDIPVLILGVFPEVVK